ncbi:glycoside hydrolase family 18 [Ornithobacterium rhinotracheale]|uniref:glycoside hydrolase family 18 n=1 Tax=Ornithobacterium rhinotracheale TaxID=28251 RepID=UPI001FF1083B|nr:glycoside hydrolase family 18 [Ornithobacterium rhinotracheale]MCK0204394.1 glycoside hydrolase family 18 [Ornithobacterium rhinotracheale]
MKLSNKYFGLILLAITGLSSCDTETESINIIEPKREIDTSFLKDYKKDLSSRKVSVGAIYDWGILNQSNLIFTPDSLDIIVVKNNYFELTPHQQSDLKEVKEKKATKVLIGADFNSFVEEMKQWHDKTLEKRLAEKEKELSIANDVIDNYKREDIMNKIKSRTIEDYKTLTQNKIKSLISSNLKALGENDFDGMSIELPEIYENDFIKGLCVEAITAITAKLDQSKLLIIENPIEKMEQNTRANLLVSKKSSGSASLGFYETQTEIFAPQRYMASIDFTEDPETLGAGFNDSKIFNPSGNLSKIQDIVHWQAANNSGVMFYHIEKDYTNIKNKNAYNTLKNAINQIQKN